MQMLIEIMGGRESRLRTSIVGGEWVGWAWGEVTVLRNKQK